MCLIVGGADWLLSWSHKFEGWFLRCSTGTVDSWVEGLWHFFHAGWLESSVETAVG